MTSFAAAPPPAGGAETIQVIGVTLAAMLLTGVLLWYGNAHRRGRDSALGRTARLCERLSGEPGWAAFPAALATVSLLGAGLGLYWDVALHIAQGRDDGPLANPSHYFILLGLFGIFAAGWAAIVLPRERPGAAAVRIAGDWYAPVGGILLTAAASFALIGFPLDDVWHRLFGQDVTLWGPTHLMLIGGGVLTIPAVVILLAEGRLARRSRRPSGGAPATAHPLLARLWGRGLALFIALATGGGLLAGLAAFQGEFDFGVPQYHLLFHPLTLAVASGLALVAARILVGPGGALGAALFFLGLRGALALIVGPGLGDAVPATPLFLAEAAIVELVALHAATRRSPYRLALTAGPAIGLFGTLAEYAWSHAVMPVPWPAHMLPEALLVAIPAATGAAVVGAFVGGALKPGSGVGVGPRAWAPPLAGAATATLIGLALLPGGGSTPNVRALIELDPVDAKTANVTVRLSPRDSADGAYWVQGLAWQGEEHRLVAAPMRRLADGVYRTTEPLPTTGSWKSMVRIHRGRTRMSVPVYLPADPAIPVPGVPARARAERSFERDIVLLQRERKLDAPGWLWPTASMLVALLAVAIIVLNGWGLLRIARTREAAPAPRPPTRTRARPHARPDRERTPTQELTA